MQPITGVPAERVRAAARLYATAGNGAIYYGLGRHRTQPGLDHGDGHRESRHGHRQHRAARALGSTRCAARTMCRARATWVPSRTNSPATGTSRTTRCAHAVRGRVGRAVAGRTGPAHSEHVRGRARWRVQGPVHRGRGHRSVRPQHPARHRGAQLDGMHHRAGLVPERVGEVRARVSAGLLFPGEGRHLHQCRAAHLEGAQGDGAQGRLRRLGGHAAPGQCGRLPDELRPPRRNHG